MLGVRIDGVGRDDAQLAKSPADSTERRPSCSTTQRPANSSDTCTHSGSLAPIIARVRVTLEGSARSR